MPRTGPGLFSKKAAPFTGAWIVVYLQEAELGPTPIYSNTKDEDPIMISSLQHFVFCPRQCALIHIEQAWEENLLTAQGSAMHEHVHTTGKESRKDIKVARDLPLRSLGLGLVGKADVVEFLKIGHKLWQPFPVEYKRGKPKTNHSDMVQLCAQAICLEEMLSVTVPTGALFYGSTRRRLDVVFDTDLKRETCELVEDVHRFITAGVTPPPEYSKKCKSCSLIRLCMPRQRMRYLSVGEYVKQLVADET